MTGANPLDPVTPLSRLTRDVKTGDLKIAPAGGRADLNSALNQAARERSNLQANMDQLATGLLGLIGVQPVSGFAQLCGYPTQNGGSTYAPLHFGSMPSRYVETTLTSESWSVGAEIPGTGTRHLQYVSLAGDSPGASTYTFRPAVAFRIPAGFRGFKGNAIVFRYTIEDVSGYTNGDVVRAKLLVESTVPGFSAVTKTREETLSGAPGPTSDGGVYSTLSMNNLDLGTAWQEGDLLRVTPSFELTCAASGVTVDLRWADLRINME